MFGTLSMSITVSLPGRFAVIRFSDSGRATSVMDVPDRLIVFARINLEASNVPRIPTHPLSEIDFKPVALSITNC